MSRAYGEFSDPGGRGRQAENLPGAFLTLRSLRKKNNDRCFFKRSKSTPNSNRPTATKNVFAAGDGAISQRQFQGAKRGRVLRRRLRSVGSPGLKRCWHRPQFTTDLQRPGELPVLGRASFAVATCGCSERTPPIVATSSVCARGLWAPPLIPSAFRMTCLWVLAPVPAGCFTIRCLVLSTRLQTSQNCRQGPRLLRTLRQDCRLLRNVDKAADPSGLSTRLQTRLVVGVVLTGQNRALNDARTFVGSILLNRSRCAPGST